MTNPFDQLNLRPQERRILVVVALIIFVVLNILFVTPLFGKLAQTEGTLDRSKQTLAKYEREIDKVPTLERLEARLKSEGGDVLSEELQLQRIVNNQAISANVQVSRSNPASRTQIGRTNQFFEDQALTIDFNSGGKELVDFLVGMASGNSMIHVHDMSLRAVAGGTRLGGTILFVATYQKKNIATPKGESGAAPRPSTKTATPPAATPAASTTVKTNKTAAPPSRTTNAPSAKTNFNKTISTNSAKPLKK
jgi:Tfp pilus assembly protein PilO